MPITINGSGTVTGISAGGLPDGVITTDDIAANAVTDAKLTGTTCKAWVNFNGTGAVAIRASYNVSSITDNGTGQYTITFTTALADANYAIAGCSRDGVNGETVVSLRYNVAPTASAVAMNTSAGTSFRDADWIHCAVFR